ncbi:hypothetical protein HN258_15135 [Acinetobacter baumannii]|uniref:hypothetical protein n=1 Tax=Acinetobacter baumannii TaxID=470 RepID=UPI00189BAA92|nr:hypothetical protein [Acinetobacter baumannii]MBF6918468.1 hypothetical protein [Acinetobacter baumannii]
MIYLFALLFMVSLIAAFIGLVKPSVFQFGKPTIPSRWKVFGIGLLISMLSLALVGVFAPKVEEKNSKEMAAVKDPVVVANPDVVKELEQKVLNATDEANLGMNPEQFRQAFNKRLKDLDIDTIRPFGEFDVKKGDVHDVFQVNVSPDVSLTGTVNHDGMLRGITYIVVPSGDSQKAMMDTLILVGITSNIISGEENKSKTSKVVTDLLTKALDGIDKEKNSHNAVVGNVKYFATASKLTGLWFGVEPVNAD